MQTKENQRLYRLLSRNQSELISMDNDIKALKAKIKGLSKYIGILKQQQGTDAQNKAFKIFANLHPAEAYELDKTMFCNYVREKTGQPLTDDQIYNLIKLL